MNQNYNQKIRGMREKRAWSQEQLAEICGVGVRTVQRAEAGEPIGFDSLRAIASGFEIDVREFTECNQTLQRDHDRIFFFRRLETGRDLFGVIGGAHAFRFAHDELEESVVEEVADFIQELNEWGDLWDEIEPGERIRTTHSYTERIGCLESLGYMIFGLRTKSTFTVTGNNAELAVANVFISRASNPTISKTTEGELLPIKLGD